MLRPALLALCLFYVPLGHTAPFTDAAQVRPDETVDELIKKALSARSRGQFVEARAYLEEAAALEPQNLDVQFYLGLTLYNLSDMKGAETTLRAVLATEPKYVDAKIILARVLMALGQFQESETLLHEAIAQTPDYLDAYDALASNLAAQKKFSAAIDVLDQGLERAPEDVGLLSKKGTLLFIDHSVRGALEVAEKLLSLTKIEGQYAGLVLKAKILFEENPTRIKSTAALLNQAIALVPASSEAPIVLSDVYVSVWKFQDAEIVLQEALLKVQDKDIIKAKLSQLSTLSQDVSRYSLSVSGSKWKFDERQSNWREFYLDGVWKVDPYKTLVFGLEQFTRDGISDSTLRVEYVQKINKWIYVFGQGRYTPSPDFREHNGTKVGANFVTNPLSPGATVIVTEGETRSYETGRIYFFTLGADQYLGKSFIINLRLFHVLNGVDAYNVWNTKLIWNVTDRFQLSAGYGTMTEDVSGVLRKGHSYNLGTQVKINDRFFLTGNYTRYSNELYKANQVTVGLKMNLGPRKRK